MVYGVQLWVTSQGNIKPISWRRCGLWYSVLILDLKTNLEVAAGGTVMGDKMNLDMISLGNVSLYSITMTVIGNSGSGSYTAYRPGEPPSGGPANGIRSPTRS
jgi:hypothetical protein